MPRKPPNKRLKLDQPDRSSAAEVSSAEPGAEPSPLDLPVEHQLAHYRAWRKSGSEHDDLCFICRQPGDLVECYTCHRSYHRACLPENEVTHESHDRWYCSVCVTRGWHLATPPLSPPGSPRLAPAGDQPPDSVPPESALIAIPANPQAAHIPEPGSGAPAQPPPAPRRAAPVPERGRNRHRRAGRSRYATLRPEVETALSTLYSELETSNALSEEVSHLKEELSLAQQDIGLLRRELEVHRKATAWGQSAQQELNRLRQQKDTYEQRDKDVALLMEQTMELRRELCAAKEAVYTKEATLDEWKQKLKGFFSDIHAD